MSKGKAKLAKKATPKRIPKTPLTSTKLNRRQEKLKKIMIATRGLPGIADVAKELGIHRATVWEDMRLIQNLGEPRDLEGWNELRLPAG